MTLFEYLAAGHTLILTFAVIRALTGFPHVLRSESRYWVHTIWLGVGLAYCLVAFWAFWSYREVEWTLVRFMGILEVPAVIFVFNSILIPPDAAAVDSWRDHFFRVRAPLFATGTFLMVSIVFSNYFLLGTFRDPAIAIACILLAVFAVGLASAQPRLHALLAMLLPALFVATVLLVLNRADALVR